MIKIPEMLLIFLRQNPSASPASFKTLPKARYYCSLLKEGTGGSLAPNESSSKMCILGDTSN